MRKSTAILGIVMLIAITVSGIGLAKEGIAIFSDIEGHWAEEVVTRFALSRLVSGYNDGSFRPETSVTKAEFARALSQVYRKTGKYGDDNVLRQEAKVKTDLIGQAVKEYYAQNGFTYPVELYNTRVQWQKISLPLLVGTYLPDSEDWYDYDYYLRADAQVLISYYPDVTPNDWYFQDVTRLYQAGVHWSDEEGFRPNTILSRQDVAALLVVNINTAGEGEFSHRYSDLEQVPARPIIERAILLGLMQGYSDGTFRPYQHLTRAEAVTVLSHYELLLGL